MEARDYIYANQVEDGTCFSVSDAKGKRLFWIQYTENMALGIKKNDFPDYEKCILDGDCLDLSF